MSHHGTRTYNTTTISSYTCYFNVAQQLIQDTLSCAPEAMEMDGMWERIL